MTETDLALVQVIKKDKRLTVNSRTEMLPVISTSGRIIGYLQPFLDVNEFVGCWMSKYDPSTGRWRK